jgi:hypothetical protein
MKLDRKFLLIAPTMVLVVIVAGLFYATTQLRLIVQSSDNLPRRSAYVAQLEQGTRQISNAKAIEIVRLSLEAEQRRTAAITAANELLITLGLMTLGCCAALFWVIKGIPRTLPLRGPVLFHIKTSPGST